MGRFLGGASPRASDSTTSRRGHTYEAVPDRTPNALREHGLEMEHENDDNDAVRLNAAGANSSDQVDSDTEEDNTAALPPPPPASRQQSDAVVSPHQQQETTLVEVSSPAPQQERVDRKDDTPTSPRRSADADNNNNADDYQRERSASRDSVAAAPTETENEAEEDGSIHVRVLDLNGKHFTIKCRLDWLVSTFKEKVAESTEVAIASQRLIYRGRVLEDDKVLDDYKLEDGHTIHLFVRMNHTPEPEPAVAEASSTTATPGGHIGRFDDGVTIVHITSDTISSAVFPSDSARRVDPLMLDSPLGNCARRVKLWSSFLLIIYTMKVMGQFALLANDQQMRAEEGNKDDANKDRYYDRYDYPPYYNQDPTVSAIELMIHAFGVYVGCVGFKAAHDTDIRPIRFYCRGIVWLAILTIAEQIFVTYQISNSDYPETRIQYPYGPAAPSKEDIVSANIFQTIMLVVMWIIAIHHSYAHQQEVSRYNESFAAAAMNAVPPAHLPEVV